MAFQRLRMLVGAAALERLRGARVGVFGLGAVGSFAVEALARCGVGSLRVVDFDSVKESNLNRQLYALRSSVGEDKVALAAARIADINPACLVDARRTFFCAGEAGTLLHGLDWVIDAIDSLNPKVQLSCEAHGRGIAMVAVMGAARRFDPNPVLVTDISEVRGCPLSAVFRKRLHRHGIYTGITAVWSQGPVFCPPPDAVVPEGEVEAGDTLERGRRRDPLPSIIFGPAAMGLAAAQKVVTEIISLSPGTAPPPA
ncbi:MAG: tRNA threonylcarbamoyladenosine dehydratase [Myxococcota bacterium]|jgi:tRNA A37 threonylcarbamoyladenosine dehydratase